MTPEYIIEHWTDEMLSLMVEKLAERKARIARAWRGEGEAESTSEVEFFRRAGIKYIQVNHD